MVVREVLGSIERPFAWTSARACATTKNIIASGLTQLREQGWLPEMGGKRGGLLCNGPADLLNVLKASRNSKSTAYWVIDDVETLTEGARSTEGTKFLQFLVQLKQFQIRCKLCIILISRVSWDSFQQGSSYEENGPTSLFFPAYTVQQLQEILLSEREVLIPKLSPSELLSGAVALSSEEEKEKQWKRFLNIVVPSVSQCTNSIHMLRYLSSKLFGSYACDDGAEGKRFKPKLQKVIQHMRAKGISNVTLAEFFERERVLEQQSSKDGGDAEITFGCEAVPDLHSQAFVTSMPYMGKMILLAAYIAGWNPHTSDNRIFGRTKTVKRRRKDPLLMNKKAEKIQEAKLGGPGTFTVERLVSILKSLFKLEGDYLEDSDLLDKLEESGDTDYEDYLRTKVHSQETYQIIKTFTSQSLLSPGSVESASMCCEHYRLQCNLKEAAALKIAKGLGINLHDYLVYI
ncbi:subunit 5 of origin of replication complex [Chloropicon primus]|uniref:Subunit 5 of origin of replication complex n=1 Tax=Chloropicon primus TaxID=1764295 RepID=A0A5B8MXZ6_9CHLO|nr:subunit 5 of origin of replication complex [Chloropicon primus]UPR04649.1 subunit 5 of origin of replication complex [Chloropicon primus]|eukprot:QDZ25453.1 subunit 5 of origin of replication complex [Chloropicon primus]